MKCTFDENDALTIIAEDNVDRMALEKYINGLQDGLSNVGIGMGTYFGKIAVTIETLPKQTKK